MTKIKKKSLEKGKKSFIAWMVVVGVLLIGSYAAFMGMKSKPHKHPGNAVQGKAVDPVCGMEVIPPAKGHIEYRAKHYYFCSKTCKDDFEKEPEKYLK